MPLFGRKLNFKGKHVLVTGGSAGIGFEIAKRLVKAGADVTIVARTRSKLEEAVKQLQDEAASSQSQSKISLQAADVTDYQQVRLHG